MNRRRLVLVALVVVAVFAALLIAYHAKSAGWEITPLGQMLGSGLAATLLTQLLTWLKEHKHQEGNKDSDRLFIALQLAVVLERYAIECASRIGEIERKIEQSIEDGCSNFSIPGLAQLTLPKAAEWRWLNTELASEVLSLAPKIDFANGSFEFMLEVTDLHSAADEAALQLGIVGLDAWRLAEKVRRLHGIPIQAYELGRWDFVGTLEKARTSAAELP